MQALPERASTASMQLTGLTCPDCPGVLEVASEGNHLRFRCRIGHSYSLQDLIQAKETRLEDALWAPVTALEEIAALLREAVAQQKVIGSPEEYEERAARADRHAAVIRQVIEESQPTNLSAESGGGDE